MIGKINKIEFRPAKISPEGEITSNELALIVFQVEINQPQQRQEVVELAELLKQEQVTASFDKVQQVIPHLQQEAAKV